MNLNQVTLPATDVERSADFYRRLGFTQIVSALPRYARFECQNGATFSLHAFDTVLPSQTVVYFECDDLDATYERLCKLGIEFNDRAGAIGARNLGPSSKAAECQHGPSDATHASTDTKVSPIPSSNCFGATGLA